MSVEDTAANGKAFISHIFKFKLYFIKSVKSGKDCLVQLKLMVAKINKKPSPQPIYNVIYNKIQIYIFLLS